MPPLRASNTQAPQQPSEEWEDIAAELELGLGGVAAGDAAPLPHEHHHGMVPQAESPSASEQEDDNMMFIDE
jgi:hypothetical protein